MENQAPQSQSIPERGVTQRRKALHADSRDSRKPPVPKEDLDWHSGSGIIDQMSAYSDWWNLPAVRSSNPGRHRIPGSPKFRPDRG